MQPVYVVIFWPGLHYDVEVVGVFRMSQRDAANACLAKYRGFAREHFLARSDAEKARPVGWAKLHTVPMM